MTALLEIDRLCRYFGGVKAVHDVTFAVRQGSIHGLIGPNGSGKTTLFNCLTGIYHPTSGHVRFKGKRLDRSPPHRTVARGIARTFQNLRLFAGMTALENVMVARHRHLHAGLAANVFDLGTSRRDHREAVAKAQELLEFCGLAGREDAVAGGLPYGLQRRLEIARALATEPELLLLDEPAAGMNPAESAALKELIVDIRRRGITVFIIEHNVRLVMGLCDIVTVMDSGEVIAFDVPERIVNHPGVIEAYLGREDAAEMNG